MSGILTNPDQIRGGYSPRHAVRCDASCTRRHTIDTYDVHRLASAHLGCPAVVQSAASALATGNFHYD